MNVSGAGRMVKYLFSFPFLSFHRSFALETPSLPFSNVTPQTRATPEALKKTEAVSSASNPRKIEWGIAALLLLIFTLLCIGNIRDYSPTFDELKFLRIGRELASGEGWQTEMSVVHAPLSFYTHGFLLRPFHFSNELQRLRWARAVMLIYALALGALVFKWASQLFTAKGGLVALALYVCNPNILAHSSLITTDVIYACFSFFLLYFLWRLMTDGKLRWAFACGLSLGLALLSKYSAVFWFLLIPALVLFLTVVQFFRRRKENSAISFGEATAAVFIIFFVALIILNIGYGFSDSFFLLGSRHYQSRLLTTLSSNPLTSWIPAPAPFPFVRGYDAQKYISEMGHPSFLAGMRSTGGWWYYYPLALLLKMPAAFWPLIIISLAVVFREADQRRRMASSLLLAAAMALIVAHSFLSRSQAGLRYILVALPPLFVLGGAAARYFSTRWIKAPVLGLVVLYAAPALWFRPHHLAYFSEIIGGPANGYKWLSDSNLDWGQDAEKAFRYARESKTPMTVNPGILPVAGRILINATTLQDCFSLQDIHGWLREFEPIGNIGYSWLIFDIDESAVKARTPGKSRLPDEYYFAAFAYSRDHLQAAENSSQAALTLHPQLPEGSFLLGLAQMGLGKLDEAAKAFEAIPQSHPLYVEARSNLSFLAALRGDGESSRRFQKQAMTGETLLSFAKKPPPSNTSMSKDGYKIHNNSGVYFWMQGNLPEAEREIRTALEIQPGFAEGLANLAIILEERGAFAEALETALQYNAQFLLLKNSPYRDYRVYYQDSKVMLGDALEIFPKPDIDILRLKAYLAVRPDDPATINELAVLLMKRGQFSEAYERLQQHSMSGIGAGALYNNLAVLYMEKKMFSEADAACRRSLKENPENSRAAGLLAFLEEKAAAARIGQGHRE